MGVTFYNNFKIETNAMLDTIIPVLKKIFEEECKKYKLLYKMSDIVKAYKKEIKQQVNTN